MCIKLCHRSVLILVQSEYSNAQHFRQNLEGSTIKMKCLVLFGGLILAFCHVNASPLSVRIRVQPIFNQAIDFSKILYGKLNGL